MTFPSLRRLEPAFCVRLAEPVDSPAISDLYVRNYTPKGGGEPRDHYPFPQIMEPDNVAHIIMGGNVVWVVTEGPNGAIVGSAAAVRNIGGEQARVAEVFGVAVEKTCWGRGVGSALLRKLVEQLKDSAEFILCEARTAEAGGWKVARNAGFLPVGFEPYAHAMPVGFESMVLTAVGPRGPRACVARPRGLVEANATTAVLRLAQAVCQPGAVALPSTPETGCPLPKLGALDAGEVFSGSLTVRRDDHAGQAWFASQADISDIRSPFVGFCPFLGVEPRFRRFDHAYYVASAGTSDLAAARVIYDRTDARVRILGLRAVAERVQSQFLRGILKDLLRLSGGGPLVVVVWVRAGALAIQVGLEAMGFFPTVYLPGLISVSNRRTDVVQYTRLFGRSLSDSVHSVTAMEWREARRIIDQVLQFNTDGPP